MSSAEGIGGTSIAGGGRPSGVVDEAAVHATAAGQLAGLGLEQVTGAGPLHESDPTPDLRQPIMAIDRWVDNAALIADVARLGYLRTEWRTLDPTYGLGNFWTRWRPAHLCATDLDPAKSPSVPAGVDFTAMPWADRSFACVVLDPPYKLNGTPSDTGGIDEKYGVHVAADWRSRMGLIRAGIRECARVLGDGYFLLKCQDQVHSGRVRWQTYEFIGEATAAGLGLVDRLDILSYRPQPAGRRQVHARRNASTLLIFKRGWATSDVTGDD